VVPTVRARTHAGGGSTPDGLSASTDASRMYLWARGVDGRVYDNSTDGGTWSGWGVLPV
jgi:hypothetical protein